MISTPWIRRITWAWLAIVTVGINALLAALAFDVASSGSSAGPAGPPYTLTFSHTNGCSSNCVIIVGTCITTGGGTSASGITYSGAALTEATAAGGVFQSSVRTQLFYKVSPASGANNVVITENNGNGITAAALTYSGVDTSTPFGTPVTAGASTGSPTLNVSASSGEVVIDVVCTDSAGTGLAPDGSQAELKTVDLSSANIGMSSESGPGTITMSWTGDGVDWAQIGVALKPLVTAGKGGYNRMQSRRRR